MTSTTDELDGGDLESFEIQGKRYFTVDEYMDECRALAQRGPLSSETTESSTLHDKENVTSVDDGVKLDQETLVSSSASVRGPFRIVSASATSSSPSTTLFVPKYDKTDDELEKKTPTNQLDPPSAEHKVLSRDDFPPRRATRDRHQEVSTEAPPPKKKSRPLVYTDSDNDDDDDDDSVTAPVNKREDPPLKADDDTEKEEWEKWIVKKHNEIVGIFENDVVIEDGVVTRLFLEDDPISGRLVEVNAGIIAELLPHQFRGAKFMYENCFGRLGQDTRNNYDLFTSDYLIGPVREVQVAVFAQAVLKNESRPEIRTILILCPVLKREIWSAEIQRVLENVEPDQRPLVHNLWEGQDMEEKIKSLNLWTKQGGVAILDFELFQQLDEYYVDDNDDDSREAINNSLFTPGPAIVFKDLESIDRRYINRKYKGLVKITTTRQIVLPDLYSNDPVQHINRVICRDWLTSTTTGFLDDHEKKFEFLCDLVDYHAKREVHWIQKRGFATIQNDGSGYYFLKSDFPNQWRKAISSRARQASTTPERRVKHKLYTKELRSNTPGTYVFYILVISPIIGPLTVGDLCNPNSDMTIYVGEWDASYNYALITSRPEHFTNNNCIVYKLTSDPKNQCNEVLAQQCLNQFVAHFGEAFILYYAHEWNKKNPEKPKFILTSPEVQNLDEDGNLEKQARQMARDGIWIFAALQEDGEPHPPQHARFEEICTLPFMIKPSYIKRRVIPGLGQGSNDWK
ncbi:Transcriptional regulator ATRX [Folsomia candida]|uniref:Transcriptional regulator ATRX n=1 Tax=Folsomia candida TaxID=158441 RepID=A0A226EW16_FOLCA|nr:Transcriptional regulator ATRX [Folsomia candida]